MFGVKRLVWDRWNIAHIARHDVLPEEVEAICHYNPLVQKGKKGRLLVIGPSRSGRMLTVILDPEEVMGVYYPVTARSASKRERRTYTLEKERGDEK